jgi:hypothetical protein
MPLYVIAVSGAGWQDPCRSLGAYLSGREAEDVGSRWAEIVPAYQEMAAKVS